jgi:hypothetical protein
MALSKRARIATVVMRNLARVTTVAMPRHANMLQVLFVMIPTKTAAKVVSLHLRTLSVDPARANAIHRRSALGILASARPMFKLQMVTAVETMEKAWLVRVVNVPVEICNAGPSWGRDLRIMPRRHAMKTRVLCLACPHNSRMITVAI